VASLSLIVRPWAYEQSYSEKEKAKGSFDVTRLKTGRFYSIGGKDRVIFINKIDHKLNKAEGVFIQQNSQNKDDAFEVIYAKNAFQRFNQFTDSQEILFSDGWIHKFSRTGKGEWEVTKFDQLAFSLLPKEIPPMAYKRKAASSFSLARSHNPSDIAELQWRFSTSLSTILLALLGVPLSRTTPRKGKYGNIVVSMLIYAFYYGLSTMIKILVTQGTIPTLPGIWWVQILLVGMLYTLLFHPFHRFRRYLRRG
jgi:lipopolysaccharide export system permease protein